MPSLARGRFLGPADIPDRAEGRSGLPVRAGIPVRVPSCRRPPARADSRAPGRRPDPAQARGPGRGPARRRIRARASVLVRVHGRSRLPARTRKPARHRDRSGPRYRGRSPRRPGGTRSRGYGRNRLLASARSPLPAPGRSRPLRACTPCLPPARTLRAARTPGPARAGSPRRPRPVVLSRPRPVVLSRPRPVVLSRPRPVVLSRPRPVVLSRSRPVVLAWPAPVVAYRPVPILRIRATWIRRLRMRGAGIGDRPWPGTCPAARLCRPGPGRPRTNSGGPWAGPGRPCPVTEGPGPIPWAAARPRHSRRNSPASRVVGPVRVRRLPRAVGIALVSGYAARISGRTRGAPRPGRRAGTRVAQVAARTRCPLGAGGPGGDSRRRSRPRFRPFGVRPVRIRPYLPQRDPMAGGVPVAPGGAVAQRGVVPLRGASAFPPPLVVLIRPGTVPPFVAFPARAANRGLVVFVCVLGLVARMFVCVLGLVARMPVPVVRGTAIYPVPITVGCGVTTFHRAPPGHFDSDAPAHSGISS